MDPSYILEQLKRSGYNIGRTARSLDLEYEVVDELFGPDIKPPRKPTEPRPVDFRQLGKIGLRRHVVAVKPCNVAEWPEEFFMAIRSSRHRYDAGTHEMFTETRDGWNILYCQPRRNPVAPRNYFYGSAA